MAAPINKRRGPGPEGPRVFEARVGRMIETLGAAEPGRRWLAALSGGADSVALLRVLAALAPQRGWTLSAIHVHHGLRGASADGDQRFCERLCRELGVPLTTTRLALAKGAALAERSREARYRALDRQARRLGAHWIALAHHGDDQAETFLARLARGAPLSGLAAIPPLRGPYVRPLLFENRARIASYLERLGQPYREDPSNRSLRAERVRIRRRVLPVLEQELGRPVRANLARAASEAAEMAAYLESQARSAHRRLGRQQAGGLSFSVRRLRALARPVRWGLWRLVLEELGPAGRRAQTRQVEALENLLMSPQARGPLALAGRLSASKESGRIVLSRPAAPPRRHR